MEPPPGAGASEAVVSANWVSVMLISGGFPLFRDDVLNDALGGVKRSEVIQTKRLDSNLDLFRFRNAQRPLLLSEVVVCGVQQHAQGQQAYEF